MQIKYNDDYYGGQNNRVFTVKEAIFDYLCNSESDDFMSKLVNMLYTNGILSDDDIMKLLGCFYEKYKE